MNYSFTPYRFIEAFLQYNSRSQQFSSNIRFGWTTTSGTGLYVVYNDRYATPGERFDPLSASLSSSAPSSSSTAINLSCEI